MSASQYSIEGDSRYVNKKKNEDQSQRRETVMIQQKKSPQNPGRLGSSYTQA